MSIWIVVGCLALMEVNYSTVAIYQYAFNRAALTAVTFMIVLKFPWSSSYSWEWPPLSGGRPGTSPLLRL